MYTVTFLSYPMHPRNAQQSRSGHWLAHTAPPEPPGSVCPAQRRLRVFVAETSAQSCPSALREQRSAAA